MTVTRTNTNTIPVVSSDVRFVMSELGRELETLLRISQVPADFDADRALVDASILARNGLVESLQLQYYVDRELVREHAYWISEEPLQAYGPPADRPPVDGLDYLPAGCRVRLAAMRHRSVSIQRWDEWMSRLGWIEASPLQIPPDLRRERYGAFASGGFGIHRELACNPRYDRPVDVGGTVYAKRGTGR